MIINLNLMCLNCWGLPFPVVCQNRQERICAVGDYLLKCDHDIVCLQEIWLKSDYYSLKEKVEKILPFSHYYYNGAIGSGLCIFSKYRITDTMFFGFPLNGHPHKIFHGDWFAGKGIGLCSLHIDSLVINLYCTHFHGEYNPGHDEYDAHRLSQALQLCQFVRRTSWNCDLVIVAGDLNRTPSQLGYKLITVFGSLQDSWMDENNLADDEEGMTCDVPGNVYADKKSLSRFPEGVRIDYIMYQAKENCAVTVSNWKTGLGKIQDLNIDYSDHEAVIVNLTVEKKEDSVSKISRNLHKPLSQDQKECLRETQYAVNKGINQCINEERFFQCMIFVFSLALYVVTNWLFDIPTSYDLSLLMMFSIACLKLGLAIAIGACVWTSVILKRAEHHALIACVTDITNLLDDKHE